VDKPQGALKKTNHSHTGCGKETANKKKGSHAEGTITGSNLVLYSSIPKEQDSGKVRQLCHGS